MSLTVVIHQPDFLPWLGFFHRLLHADLFIALDHAQFVTGTSRNWANRDRVKTSTGPRWLSLHVRKAPLGTPIREILLAPDPAWRSDNLNLLRESYRRAPYFDEIFPGIEALYAAPHTRLVDMTLASIDLLCNFVDIQVPRRLSSEMAPVGANNEMLVDLLRKAGATHYLSGLGAQAYFDPAPFANARLEVRWQAFEHPVYPQQHGGFVPMLSTIDLLFNCGADQAREILRRC